MSGEPVKEQYIEYTYTSYKMPASEDIISGGAELAQAIAARIFPDAQEKYGQLWNIAYEGKNYVCGFVKNGAINNTTPTEMYFVTVKAGEIAAQQISCYKCNVGEVQGALMNSEVSSSVGIAVKHGGINNDLQTTVFGFNLEDLAWKFLLPAHSFFLEGDHQAFNDLPAGTYDAALFA